MLEKKNMSTRTCWAILHRVVCLPLPLLMYGWSLRIAPGKKKRGLDSPKTRVFPRWDLSPRAWPSFSFIFWLKNCNLGVWPLFGVIWSHLLTKSWDEVAELWGARNAQIMIIPKIWGNTNQSVNQQRTSIYQFQYILGRASKLTYP